MTSAVTFIGPIAVEDAAPTLGGRIRQARDLRGLTQDTVRQFVGCDRKTLSSWENDHTSPTVEQLRRVAAVTRFPLVWFVAGLDMHDGEPVDLTREQANPPTAWNDDRARVIRFPVDRTIRRAA